MNSMNICCVGWRLVVNGGLDLTLTALPFMDEGRACVALEETCVALEEIRRGLYILREEYPKEYARFLLRALGLERKGYPTDRWARANGALRRH